MARVKFLVDTVHPDYGYVSKGEVLKVDRIYLSEYEDLDIAEESDEDYTRQEGDKNDTPPKSWGKHVLQASGEDAGGGLQGP